MSEQQREGTRSQEHRIVIEAPPELVWKAISEADEITRWYVQDAEVEPREGGKYWISFGEGMEGESLITTFDPGRHLRLEHQPMPGSPPMPTGPIIEEYFIESEGGSTVLRLVSSGIPDTEDWDWFYDGTKRGWTVFLMTLKHYLEHHAGKPRDQIVITSTFEEPFDAAWRALAGEEGLDVDGALADASAGQRYATQTALGDQLEGRVLLMEPPYRLLLEVEGLDRALLGMTIEQMGATSMLYLSLSTYGMPPERVEDIRTRWSAWIDELFPGGGNPMDAFNAALGEGTASDA